MREKLAALVFLLLAAIVGGYAQTPAPPMSAAGVAAAAAGRTPGRKAAPPLQASHVADPQQLDPATEPSPHHGHHIFGLPLKWVVVGVAVVLAVITMAAIEHNNRQSWGTRSTATGGG